MRPIEPPSAAGSVGSTTDKSFGRQYFAETFLSSRRPFRSLFVLIAYGVLFALFHEAARYWATDEYFSTWFPGAGIRFAFLWVVGARWSLLAAIAEVGMQFALGVGPNEASLSTLLGMGLPCLMYGVAIHLVRTAFLRRRRSFFVIEHEAVVVAAFVGASLARLTALSLLIFDTLASGNLQPQKVVVSLVVFLLGDLLGVLTIAVPLLWLRRRERALFKTTWETVRSNAVELLLVYLTFMGRRWSNILGWNGFHIVTHPAGRMLDELQGRPARRLGDIHSDDSPHPSNLGRPDFGH